MTASGITGYGHGSENGLGDLKGGVLKGCVL
jgi:hypothetical protein